MIDHEFAPFVFEKAMIGGLLLLYGYVLAQRSVELLQRRYRLGIGTRVALLHVFLIAYLVVPLGLKMPERFAPVMTPFSDFFLFLFLVVISIAGALGLYVALGGKLPSNQVHYP